MGWKKEKAPIKRQRGNPGGKSWERAQRPPCRHGHNFQVAIRKLRIWEAFVAGKSERTGDGYVGGRVYFSIGGPIGLAHL